MNDNRLFYRLFVGNLLIVGIIVAGAGYVSYRSLVATFLHETEVYQDHMAVMARECIERLWPLPGQEVDRLCKRLPEDLAAQVSAGDRPAPEHSLPIRVTVIAPDGRVLGDSLADPARMVNHKTDDRPEVLAALAGRPGRHSRQSETLNAEYRYVALPINKDGRTVGALRVAIPAIAVVQNEAVIRDVLLGTALAVVGGFALIGLLVNWVWYRPLKQIAESASQIAAGDLEHPVPISGGGELSQLSVALNDMRKSITDKIAMITAQREDLETVLASMRDAVIAMDADGKVVLANRAAKELLAPQGIEIEGLHLQILIRAAGIVDSYNESVSNGRPVAKQIETDLGGRSRHLDVLVTPMTSAEKGLARLVVVRDVTDLVRTAAMKAEFVANASHELRTPLASLRAAAETLTDVDPADREDLAGVAQVIDRQIRRLEDLTHDLLILHSVENAKRAASFETVSTASLAEWLRAEFGERASKKGLALELTAPEDAFAADRLLVELILQNLMDNAVKFTPAGGRVACSIQRQGQAMRIAVSDTGPGIRREDQPRVFERFFQADASRQRADGSSSTGLGLAIVKHACERLGGSVSLESELGKGTTVTVVVPDQATRNV
jgi:two-component system phosphate regulon sensor histidine kinase PhoR